MRLNPLHPSDNPMDEILFCFGGPSGGGEGGGMSGSGGPPQSGGSRSSSTSTTDDAYDSGNQQTGQGSRGGSGSGGDGGNDNNNQQNRQAYSDRFGGVSTRNFNVDTNQGFVDTDKGRVYGSSEDLSKGIAEGDISPTERQDTAIDMASDIMGVDRSNVALGGDLFFGEEDVLANQDLSFGAGAAAGPALADTDIFSPTNITGEVFQTPYQQSIMTPQQRMESAYIDSAVRNFRTDQPIGLADRSVIGMMTPMEAAQNSYLNDISIGVDTSPLFDFDANNPPSAIDPSQPMVSIRGATPAEQITAEARAAANQLLGADRTRPTAAEVAAANARFASPTTPEVDAYNQAINEQIAGQLGVDSYSPGSFNAMKEVQDRALAGQYNVVGLPGSEIPGATRAMDFSDIEAADARDQGIMAAVNAAREVELETGVPANQVAGIIGLTGPAATTSRTPQEMALTGSQTFDVQPSDQGTFDPRISAGVMSDSPQQFDLEQMRLADEIFARDRQPTSVFPEGRDPQKGAAVVLDRAMKTDREGYFSPSEYETADQGPLDTNQFREQSEDETIYGGRDSGTPQAATLTEAERMSQQGVDVEMTGIPIVSTAETKVIPGQDPRAPDYTLAEAEANLEAARAEAYKDKQFGFDTGLPSQFGTSGIPTGIGVLEGIADALFQPEAALANAIAERGIRTIDGNPVPESAANYNPNGLDVVTSGGPIGEGGRTAAYDAEGNIVYDSSPFSGLNPFGEGVPENIQELYDQQSATEEELSGSDDGGDPPILPPVEKAPEEEAPPEEYKGRDVVKPYQYQPRGPLSYSYTGLPSLAPQKLRPSYSAPKKFSPLFPVS